MAEALAIGFDLPFDAAIAAAVSRGVSLPDVYYGQLQGVARQLAFSIAGIAAYDQLQAVRDSLAKAMASGQSFKEWKATAAVQALGLPKHRVENIWRTNLQGNYMRGRWEQFVRNADRRPYLMYDAINDSRVRPSHLAMDGVIRRWDDPLWRTHSAPAGFRCRCSMISLSESQAKARSGFKPDGTGTGLNKQPTMPDGTPAQPDPGWDYNPFGDRLAPILAAVENRQAAGNASSVMLEAVRGAITAALTELFNEWVSDHGRTEAEAMWRKYFGDRALP